MAKTTSQHILTIRGRAETGSRSARRLRQAGIIPGIVYGRDMDPVAVSVDRRELVHLLHSKAGEHALVTLRLENGQAWEKPAIVKLVQHDPVDNHVIHVDFQVILLTERIKVRVAVVLKGEPVGVKQDGGVLEHFLREVEVECLPTDIPEHLELDVSALKIGDTVHVRDLAAPPGTEILHDLEGAIASVQEPRAEEPAAEVAAAVTEPEVIREKKEEGEAPAGESAKGEAPEAKKDAKT